MSNQRPRRGKADPGFSGREPYHVATFAKKHGIAASDAKRIINMHGSDRDACDKAANRLK